MEYNLLRERTNNEPNCYKNGRKILKCNILKDSNKNYLIKSKLNPNIKLNEKNVLSTKFAILKKSENVEVLEEENLEKDVSMLSIHDDSINLSYYLPSSLQLKDENVCKKFMDGVISRRQHNRDLTVGDLENYSTEIATMSFDAETGNIFVLESIEYMQELECLNLPLGYNFLEGTNLSIKKRYEGITYLFYLACEFDVERYSVCAATAIADRYVKVKGNKFEKDKYKYLLISSWFMACKWDLLQYCNLEDICTIAKIDDMSIIHNFETEILETINFYLGIPSPILFLRPLSIIKQRPEVSHNIAKCFIEICFTYYDLAGHPAHILAAASYCLAMCLSYRQTKLETSWSTLHQFVMGLHIDDIREVAVTLAKCLCAVDFKKEMPGIYNGNRDIFVIVNKREEELKKLISINR